MTVTPITGIPRRERAVQDDERFLDLIRNGWSVAELADYYRCSDKTIVRTKHRLSVAQPSPQSNRRMSAEDRERLANMVADGWPVREICATTGWDPRTVLRHAGYRGWSNTESSHFARSLRRIRERAVNPAWLPSFRGSTSVAA